MNMSEERVRERLHVISTRLLRKVFGNHWRGKGRVRFLVFQHGSIERHDQHFHVLMAIEGDPHDRTDSDIATQIEHIDRLNRSAWDEKLVHVDCEWHKGNRYPSYSSRFLQLRGGEDANWFLI